MPNTRNRLNLKAQIDLLSDGHQEIALKAVDANRVLVELDERLAKGTGPSIFTRAADRHLNELGAYLEAQEERVRRIRAEIEQIRKNIRVI